MYVILDKFLGVFAKLRKAIINFFLSVRPFACFFRSRGTTLLLLDGLS
jgi:hypothetical protein